MKTDFMKLYESLSTLNEDTQSDAAKKFWATAKNKQIDEESFYAAYEDEITQLGLDSIFWTRKKADGTIGIGKLKNRGVYGDIKKAKEANPSSQAVKAVSKLWVLQFMDGAKYTCDIKEKEEKERAEAERKAEAERVAKEESELVLQVCKELLKDALTKVDQEKFEKYLKAFNITEADIDLNVVKSYSGERNIVLEPTKETIISRIDHIDYKNKDKALIKLVSGLDHEFDLAVFRVNRRSNNAIDVFKENRTKDDYYCHAILQGESDELYYIGINSHYDIKQLNSTFGTTVTGIGYLRNIKEPYKVLYTEVSYSPRNYHTNRDSHSTTYYSWDSSKASILKSLIPTIGKGEGSWSYWNTEKVNSGDGKLYSLMDGIDSWAVEYHTSIATD